MRRSRPRTASPDREADPASSSECSCAQLLSDRAEERERVISDSGGCIDVDARTACNHDVLGASSAKSGDEVGAPGVVRAALPVRQTTGTLPAALYAATTSSTPSVGPAVTVSSHRRRTGWLQTWPEPCSGNRAHRREEHRSRRAIVAHRLELAAVAVYVELLGVRATLGQGLVEVGELRDAGERPRTASDRQEHDPTPLPQWLRGGPSLMTVGRIDLAEQVPGSASDVVGELLHGVGATGGIATSATCDSLISRLEVLRAMRRLNASGSPSRSSNGGTVTEQLPPCPPRTRRRWFGACSRTGRTSPSSGVR